MHQTDVVIIGAGLAGLATAWHLGDGCKVRIVDRNARAGCESSGLGVGMVRRLVDDPVERLLAIRTVRWLSEPGNPAVSSCATRTGAIVGIAGDPSALSDAAAHLRARNLSVEALDREALSAFPLLAGSPLRNAWYLPDEWQLDPRALSAFFAQSLQQRGVSMQLGAQVQSILTDSGRAVGIRTDRGDIRADRIVLAAGAWCAGLASALGLHRPLFPLRRTVLHLAADRAQESPWVWIDDVGLYARRTDRGWWVSPCDEAVDFPSPAAHARKDAQEKHIALAHRKISRWMPSLDGSPLLDSWSGLRTFAPDRRPVLGPDRDLPGLFWAAALGGYGASGGFAAGEATAHWLLGKATPWLPHALVSPNRPHLRRWPIRPDGEAEHAALIDGTLPSV